jgi:MFS transporter, DHA1 family, tetracycline resistance protein
MPVLPRLIEDVGDVDIARAAVIGGWMFAAFSWPSSSLRR